MYCIILVAGGLRTLDPAVYLRSDYMTVLNEIPSSINGFKIISKLNTFSGNNRHYIAECKVCFKHYQTTIAWLKKANSCSCSWKTNGVPRRLQNIYGSMKDRCSSNTSHQKNFNNYFMKGIRVCDEWLKNSHKFYEWALY